MQIYYIDPSGSTGNTGFTELTPWPASQLNLNLFSSDDVIYCKKGATFNGTFTFISSGTAGHNITIREYGTATNNPAFDAQGSTTKQGFKITGAYVTTKNLVFQNCRLLAYGNLFISNTHDVTVQNCYVHNGYRGIHAQGCTGNINIYNNWVTDIAHFQNAAGPSSGDGAHIQFDNCTGSGLSATYNNIYANSATPSGIGDLISLYISTGTSSSYIDIGYNLLRGGGTGTNGYCSIGVGDNNTGLAYQNIHDNIMVGCQYAGIQIAGGNGIIVDNNKIVVPQTAISLRAITCFTTGGGTQSPIGVTVTNNKCNAHASNGNIANYYLQAGVATPTGWPNGGGNTNEGVADAAAFDSLLSSDLGFSLSPWNTVTTTGSYAVIYRQMFLV